jgi:hypothetical protein
VTVALETRPCAGCGKPIVWAVNPDSGTPMPLDPRPPVYRVVNGQAIRVPDVLVLHFATCSDANRFGKNKPKDQAPRKDLFS